VYPGKLCDLVFKTTRKQIRLLAISKIGKAAPAMVLIKICETIAPKTLLAKKNVLFILSHDTSVALHKPVT
jgi:hypothetical protein